MKEQRIDLVIVGADRIARNGDTANKIGTYALAIFAAHHGIPFYVAAPRSTFDLTIASGDDDSDRGASRRRGHVVCRRSRRARRRRRLQPGVRRYAGASRHRVRYRIRHPAAAVRRVDSGTRVPAGAVSDSYEPRRPKREILRFSRQGTGDRQARRHRRHGTRAGRARVGGLARSSAAAGRARTESRAVLGRRGRRCGARLSRRSQAMPFLADRRVVVVSDTQTMRAAARRDLWAVAQNVPEGSTLVLLDLLSPRGKGAAPFGVLAGRAALRIDTTAGEETRERFVEETLRRLKAKAEPRAIDELARSEAELAAVPGSAALGSPCNNSPSAFCRATQRSKSTSMPRASSLTFTSRMTAKPPCARISILTRPMGSTESMSKCVVA